jgi:glutamate-1-semialdehyde 2,1-aminomutase
MGQHAQEANKGGAAVLAQARAELATRTPKSAAHRERVSKLVPQEVIKTLALPHPIYIERADGPYLFDIDGNRYVDMALGFGAHILGHRPESVRQAVAAQLDRGWQYGIHNVEQEPLARLLEATAPAVDAMVFSNSGTEATMCAMRAARAFTGKPKVAVFDGSYHGTHDYALLTADPKSARDAPESTAIGQGVPSAILSDTTIMLPYLERAAFDTIRNLGDQLALVIVQGVQNRSPHLGAGAWLGELQAVCRQTGVLFLLDEVVTGFRVAYGGCQELFSLEPDLVTYGKGVGGGFPIGITAGRADVMSLFYDRAGPTGIMAGGTFNGNPISMAAASAAVGEMHANKDTLYPRLNTLADRLAENVNTFCRSNNYAAQLMNAGSIFCMRLSGETIKSSRDGTDEDPAAVDAFHLHLLNAGVVMPGIRMSMLSAAHDEETVGVIESAIRSALEALREDGLI